MLLNICLFCGVPYNALSISKKSEVVDGHQLTEVTCTNCGACIKVDITIGKGPTKKFNSVRRGDENELPATTHKL